MDEKDIAAMQQAMTQAAQVAKEAAIKESVFSMQLTALKEAQQRTRRAFFLEPAGIIYSSSLRFQCDFIPR